MDNRPIGILDSGFGGLTAVRAFRKILPNENIVYFGDNGRAPYGIRSRDEIRCMTRQDMDFLAGFDAKAILIACGTATSASTDIIAGYPVPSFGVIDPAVRAVAALPRKAVIGITATPATIRSGVYVEGLSRLCPDSRLISIPCPDFVTVIESGHSAPEDPMVQAVVEKYIAGLKQADADVILLGCTHFGIIGQAISRYMDNGVQLVEASAAAAAELAGYVSDHVLNGEGGTVAYYTSGDASAFNAMGGILLGQAIASTAVPPRELTV